MSLGTLFITPQIRGIVPVALVKHYNLDITIADKTLAVFQSTFPLQLIPAFIAPDGFELTEVIAIMLYLVSEGEAKLGASLSAEQGLYRPVSPLLGSTAREYAEIIRWLSFFNAEWILAAAALFLPLSGRAKYYKQVALEKEAALEVLMGVVEKRLAEHRYLSTTLSLADIFAASALWRAFLFLWGREWREAHPNVVRWWKELIATEWLKDTEQLKGFTFLEEPVAPPPEGESF